MGGVCVFFPLDVSTRMSWVLFLHKKRDRLLVGPCVILSWCFFDDRRLPFGLHMSKFERRIIHLVCMTEEV